MNKFKILVIIFIISLFSLNIYGSVLDSIDLSFNKDDISVMEDRVVKVPFVITNNNQKDVSILLYTECDDDELECDFSKVYNLDSSSSLSTSISVRSIDDSDSILEIYLDDMNNQIDSYDIKIQSFDDSDDGEFEVDLSTHSFCKDSGKKAYFEIDNKYRSGLYNLTLRSNSLASSFKQNMPIYLNTSTKEVDFYIDFPTVIDDDQTHKLYLDIENDDFKTTKEFNVYLRDCYTSSRDFSVSGPNIINYNLYKDEPLTLTYNIRNISDYKKEFFVIDDNNSEILVNFSKNKIVLSPNESKEVEITFLAKKDMFADIYDLSLDFFDEKNVISKDLRLNVISESNINARVIQNQVSLNLGQTTKFQIFIENKGDIKETIDFDYLLTNGINIDNRYDKTVVNPHTTVVVEFIVSTSDYTSEGINYIKLNLDSQDSEFARSFDVKINTYDSRDKIDIEYLSFPKELVVDANTTKYFSFEIYNYSDKSIDITDIELTGIPQEITYSIEDDFIIQPRNSKEINTRLTVKDIHPQEFDATILLYSRNGSINSNNLKIVVDEIDSSLTEDETEDEPNILTGLFSLSGSIFLGLIFLLIILIVLFSTKTIRLRNREHNNMIE